MDREFLALLDRYAPEIRDALIEGISNIRDNALLVQVTGMIERNDVEGALRAIGYNPSVFNSMFAAMTQTFEAGGSLLIARQPKYTDDASGVRTMLRFNVRDLAAEKWLRDQSSTLVTAIEADIRLAVRDTMQVGLAEGRNPRNVALDLVGRYDPATGHREGGVIGLSEQGQQWSRSVRQKLLTLDAGYFEMELRDKRFDATVRAAIDAGKPLPVDVVDKLVDRYRSASLVHRGEQIGRTEALAALNRSEYEATRQALMQSDLPMEAAVKVWDSAGDARVRSSHKALDGQRAGMDEAFVSPVTGAKMMHPGDATMGAGGRDVIACRCKVRYEIDYLYEYR